MHETILCTRICYEREPVPSCRGQKSVEKCVEGVRGGKSGKSDEKCIKMAKVENGRILVAFLVHFWCNSVSVIIGAAAYALRLHVYPYLGISLNAGEKRHRFSEILVKKGLRCSESPLDLWAIWAIWAIWAAWTYRQARWRAASRQDPHLCPAHLVPTPGIRTAGERL